MRFPLLTVDKSEVNVAQYDAKQIYYLQYSNRGEKFSTDNDPGETLFNSYFGGGMNAVVFQEMREARSLAYTAFATFTEMRDKDDPYIFYAFIATQNDKMRQAVEAFDEIIENMPESEKAFELAKQGYPGQPLHAAHRARQRAVEFRLGARDGRRGRPQQGRLRRPCRGMTLADVKAFHDKWVKGRKYTYSILGDRNDIDMDYLRTLGPVHEVSQRELFRLLERRVPRRSDHPSRSEPRMRQTGRPVCRFFIRIETPRRRDCRRGERLAYILQEELKNTKMKLLILLTLCLLAGVVNPARPQARRTRTQAEQTRSADREAGEARTGRCGFARAPESPAESRPARFRVGSRSADPPAREGGLRLLRHEFRDAFRRHGHRAGRAVHGRRPQRYRRHHSGRTCLQHSGQNGQAGEYHLFHERIRAGDLRDAEHPVAGGEATARRFRSIPISAPTGFS